MQTIYAIHQPDAEKLTGVYLEMLELGAPTIRVVDCGDHYEALEGSHRLAAAEAMGLMPTLIVYAQDDMIDVTDYDWHINGPWSWPDASCEAGYVAGEIHSGRSVSYSFDGMQRI